MFKLDIVNKSSLESGGNSVFWSLTVKEIPTTSSVIKKSKEELNGF